MMFENIPDEIKSYNNWIVWRLEDKSAAKPTKVPYCPQTGKHADVTDSADWSSFLDAVEIWKGGAYDGIGFVLSENDPFAFIDLDDPFELKADGSYKNQNPDEILQRQVEIFNKFPSYAERSPSGRGLHIIVKGSIPSGRKRSSVEVYSNFRFMTMTGDVYRNLPITSQDESLNILYEQLGPPKNSLVNHYLGIGEAKYSDNEVLNAAYNAANGAKFYDLYCGNWQNYYSSQSEADFALINIIAYFSENREQVRRLFLQSALGQREKAKRADYQKWMLNRCFDHILPQVDIEGLRNQLNEAIEKKQAEESKKHNLSQNRLAKIPETVAKNSAIPEYEIPPGLVGEIARFVYEQATRPVPEVALVTALGLMSGIVGRSYNISAMGLNQYILLLAPTGTGKEAIRKGIDRLMAHVLKTVPAASEFIGPSSIASEQAITKYMAKGSASIVSILGEIGLLLQQMCHPNASSHLLGLRKFLLDVFNKSGEGDILRPSIYSDMQKNTTSVKAPAFSLIGESTPEKFYEGLHEGLISEGFLPRFTVIEYNGERPKLNEKHAHIQPSFELIEKLSSLCAQSLALNNNNKVIHIQQTKEANDVLKRFDEFCDTKINSSEREVRRQLWNRGHAKVLKLAGLIAVGCNPFDPLVTDEIANWAIKMVTRDINNMLSRFDAGDMGVDNDENRQMVKVIESIENYIKSDWKSVEIYAGRTASQLHKEKIITYSYLHKRLTGLGIFKKDRTGATNALKRTIKTLIDRGDITEIQKHAMQQKYNSTAVAYMVANPAAFDL